MNNKGFTLVEIISVIALLALVIIITVPIIGNVSESVKKKTLQTKIDNIEKAAVLYGQENREDFLNNDTVSTCLEEHCPRKDDGTRIDNCYCFNSKITVSDLISDNRLEEDEIRESNKVIVNPLDETKTLNECEIQIYQKYGKIYAIYEKTEINKNTCWVE